MGKGDSAKWRLEALYLRTTDKFRQTAWEAIPLLMILVGSAFVAFSFGPYNNWDTQLEFEAASNVNKMGIPYVESFGTCIDQPPLGFYAEAAILGLFGSSTVNVVTFVTLLGVGCVLAVYLLGKVLFGRVVGVIASALFGLNPWHIALSRSGLIDVQCLFLSLLCLYVGVFAIRRSSGKLTVVSGLLFAAAFLTKFYAVFILIPLLLLYFYSKPKSPKRIFNQTLLFIVPTLLFSFIWYNLILGRSIQSLFHHNDFIYVIPLSTNVVASPYFATNFLLNYGLGLASTGAVLFSLLLGFVFRKQLPKIASMQLLCLVTVVGVIFVNVVLGFGFNLNVPYFSAFKYLYQALPFFMLLAASLIAPIVKKAETAITPKKGQYLVTVISLALLAVSLFSTMYLANATSMRDYLQYRVEPNVDYGYALLNPTPLSVDSSLMVLQLVGFVAVFCGLLWAVGQNQGWFSKLRSIVNSRV
jgi:4-amino-4-deoxy-L-arabinose transferase-like glycosyltransferase